MAPPLTKHHPKIKRLRRLVGRRSAREADRIFVLEGAKLIHEALAGGAALEGVYAVEGTRDAVVDDAMARGVRVYDLAAGVIETVTDTVTPQPLLALASFVDVALDALRDATFLVVCAGVRDPGNAGTVLRSAAASGAGGVVYCEGSVDVYNPKTVRASAGALFHVPVVSGGDAVTTLQQIGGWGWQRLGAATQQGVAYTDADLLKPTALVLGNEAHGLDAALDAELDGALHIPMPGRAESLNVGMAAAVLCFEVARQRATR